MFAQTIAKREKQQKQKQISELIQTIKALDLIGAESKPYREKLRSLFSIK